MLSFTASAKMQSKYRTEATSTETDHTPKVSDYVHAKIATKTEDVTSEWTPVTRRGKKQRSTVVPKKTATLVLPTCRPTSKVTPIPKWGGEALPTLSTRRPVPKKSAPKTPSMSGWAKIAAKTPEMVMEEGKSELIAMQEEIAQLKAQIASAKKATAPIDVKKESIALRNFMDDSDAFCNSDGESVCWGDLVDEEYGLE